MVRSFHGLVLVSLVTAAMAFTLGCQSSTEGDSNPRPAPQPQQQQQPAAQAPAQQQQQQPAAQAGGGGDAEIEAGKNLEVSEAAMKEAEQNFAGVCATCHGTTGQGDGPAAAGFPVKPRAYSDMEWQRSVTNDDLRKVIVQGGPAVGKSPLMPGNPQLADKPEVVNGLVKMIRGYAK